MSQWFPCITELPELEPRQAVCCGGLLEQNLFSGLLRLVPSPKSGQHFFCCCNLLVVFLLLCLHFTNHTCNSVFFFLLFRYTIERMPDAYGGNFFSFNPFFTVLIKCQLSIKYKVVNCKSFLFRFRFSSKSLNRNTLAGDCLYLFLTAALLRSPHEANEHVVMLCIFCYLAEDGRGALVSQAHGQRTDSQCTKTRHLCRLKK